MALVSAESGNRTKLKPLFEFYNTETSSKHFTNVEVHLPTDVTTLEKGDVIELDVNVQILPQYAEDYWGPNVLLPKILEDHPNNAYLAQREAYINQLNVIVQVTFDNPNNP